MPKSPRSSVEKVPPHLQVRGDVAQQPPHEACLQALSLNPTCSSQDKGRLGAKENSEYNTQHQRVYQIGQIVKI
jgi:hypothetical protein